MTLEGTGVLRSRTGVSTAGKSQKVARRQRSTGDIAQLFELHLAGNRCRHLIFA